MKHYLLLLPLLVLIGCDDRQSTPAARRVSTHPTAAHSNSPIQVAKASPVSEPAPTAGSSSEQKEPAYRPAEFEERKEDPPEEAPPIPASYKALNKEKTIYFEAPKDGPRRVHLLSQVCLREGALEVFLCKLNTKEHESIVDINADGREIHFALIAAGAKPGSPIKYVPKFTAATGTRIKITVTYREKGKVKTVPASEWVYDKKTGKNLAYDWVFAGSRFFQDPDRADVPPFYMANNGELISLSNFPDSMLDLPVKSSKDSADLIFEINTKKIPPLRTPVLVTLEPVLEKK